MKVVLKDLNSGFQALRRLAAQPLPKEQFKLTWKLGRILKSGQEEIDKLQEEFDGLLNSFGIVKGREGESPEAVIKYNRTAQSFLESTSVELWGDPFKVEEILGVLNISSEDYSLLDGWLIVGDFEEKSEEKSAAAGGQA